MNMNGSSNDDVPAPVPKIDPERFDDYAIFRETFLAQITEPAINAAFRTLGEAQYSAFCEYSKYWPCHEDLLRTYLQAALADLRYLQGYLDLDEDWRPEEASEEYPEVILARRVSRDLSRIADELERELAAIEEADKQPTPERPESGGNAVT